MIYFENKLNIITLVFAQTLHFKIRKTNVKIEKNDKILLKSYNTVIEAFKFQIKLKKIVYYLILISIKMVL